jgi:hypothetical protein
MYATQMQESNVIQGNFTPEQYAEMEAIAADDTPKVNVDYSGKPLQISKSQLISMWSSGLITDKPYATLALMLDRVGANEIEDFDITKFIEDWEGFSATDKPKFLKADTILSVLKKIESLTSSSVEISAKVKLDLLF